MHDLKARTRKFTIDIIAFLEPLPQRPPVRVISYQLLKSGSSVGANYRAACRAKSDAALLNNLKDVEEEADESAYWLEILIEAKLSPLEPTAKLLNEANQLTAIFGAAAITTRRRLARAKAAPHATRKTPPSAAAGAGPVVPRP